MAEKPVATATPETPWAFISAMKAWISLTPTYTSLSPSRQGDGTVTMIVKDRRSSKTLRVVVSEIG